jgi:glutathione S-transferase
LDIALHGYRHSVYLRMARFAAAAKGVACRHVEVDPFTAPVPAEYLALHPFGRVPTLVQDGFVLYETVAITRYLDEAFAGPALQPGDARGRARMAQIQSVVDSYAYWPLVRQVFSHAVFRPRHGHQADADEIARGLAAAPRVLGALTALAGDGAWLAGDALSLADIQFAPILDAFAQAEVGAASLAGYPRLTKWLGRVRAHPAFVASDPAGSW